MDQVQELRDEVGRVGRLIEAGQRGVPIGGELLIALGLSLGLLGSLAGATAFGFLPLGSRLSPLAAAAAFLAFALLFKGSNTRLSAMLLGVAVAMGTGELIERTIEALDWGGQTVRGYAGLVLLVVMPILMFALGVLAALRRLQLSAAAAAPANRAILGAWGGLATAMAVTLALGVTIGVRTGNFITLMFLPGLFWILWGAGWWTSGAMTRSRWMYAVAAASWGLVWYAATFWLLDLDCRPFGARGSPGRAVGARGAGDA